MLDIAIIGGGPAGSTAGRLLALWGYSVAILAEPSSSRGLAECLPPSNRKLFEFLGIQSAIDGAGFFRTTGNTVWWGEPDKAERRVEPYPEGWGYQVLRPDFDRLLRELAAAAGAGIRVGKAFSFNGAAGPRIEFQPMTRRVRLPVPAKFIFDCSGRAGVLARLFRVKLRVKQGSGTVALCGIWRNEPNWELPDDTHTLVEAYGGGWAWSVPSSPSVRHVAFMIDAGEGKMARGKDLRAAYLAEMAKTRAFRDIFRHGVLESAPWGRDASVYTSSQFCGPRFLLVGDAGAFIDPLSSFGVKKAMVSAWVGAVVANTCLRNPTMQQAALEFFDERERQVFESYREQSAAWYRNAATPAGGELSDSDADAARLALEDLKGRPAIHLRRGAGVRKEKRPGIEGNEIVLRDVLVAPGFAESLDFVESVNLARLVEVAERYSQVPDVFEAYNRVCPGVTLPAFLKALSILLAKGVLINAGASAL